MGKHAVGRDHPQNRQLDTLGIMHVYKFAAGLAVFGEYNLFTNCEGSAFTSTRVLRKGV